MSLLEKIRTKKEKPPRHKETLPESISGIASVLVVGLFILTFVVQHFEIPSRSMENTLLVGDHVFVDRLTPTGKEWMSWFFPYRNLKRGDTAVFMTPNPNEQGLYLVKRIIGVPGDHIRLRNGIVYLNGVAQAEPYWVLRNGFYDPYRDEFPSALDAGVGQLAPGWYETLRNSIQNGEVVVPPGHYFAMGDNRFNSLDSRYWGFVPQENVIGRPLFIFWSFDVPEETAEPKPIPERIASFVHTTLHIFTLTRWNRVFHLVH
ncbi:MAG TPA: signal peptidase I [Candidatus Angelobacter sp.]